MKRNHGQDGHMIMADGAKDGYRLQRRLDGAVYEFTA